MSVIVVEVQEPTEAVQVLVEENGDVTTVDIPQDVVAVVVPDEFVTEIEVAVLGPQGPTGPSTIPFSRTGNAEVLVGVQRLYLEYTGHIAFVRASVGTGGAPTGAALIIDINKNGTTIYTNQANRPTIPDGQLTDLGGTPDIPNFVQGDYLTIDIDQVGSSTPGENLVVTLTLERD